jgi:hypothetical protein
MPRLQTGHCECRDAGCPVHRGDATCNREAAIALYRVDMIDRTGTKFCDDCADDAFASGLFRGRR